MDKARTLGDSRRDVSTLRPLHPRSPDAAPRPLTRATWNLTAYCLEEFQTHRATRE